MGYIFFKNGIIGIYQSAVLPFLRNCFLISTLIVTHFVSVLEVFSHAGLTGARCHLTSQVLKKAIFSGVGKEGISIFKGIT